MKKAFGVLVGFVACGPLMLALPVVIAGAGNASATSASCPPGGGPQGVDSSAVAAQVEAILKGSSPLSAPSVAGLSKPDEQIPNAKTIQATGVAMRSRWPGRAGRRRRGGAAEPAGPAEPAAVRPTGRHRPVSVPCPPLGGPGKPVLRASVPGRG
ncbi:hypothetical protein ACFWJ4_17700 [Kitasatospora sp. NPDC127067]|uniref:hypothetical protein n=1 Tax=Kitasatospora sp. NPDC127067 TaxID=3347126 RepID=UPI003660827B